MRAIFDKFTQEARRGQAWNQLQATLAPDIKLLEHLCDNLGAVSAILSHRRSSESLVDGEQNHEARLLRFDGSDVANPSKIVRCFVQNLCQALACP